MLLRALFILLFLTSPAWAMRTPLMMKAIPSTSATNYAGFASSFAATNDTSTRNISPVAGIIEGLYVSGTAAPGGSASYTITIEKNGSDTSITCVLSASATSCSSSAQVAISAGDTYSIKSVPATTPASSNLAISIIFNSLTGGGQVISPSANAVTPSTGSAQTIAIMGNQAWGQSAYSSEIPTNGTFSNLYVKLSVAPGAAASGKSYTFTLKLGGVDTALTCQVLETATTCNDTIHSFAAVTGNAIQLSSTPSGTPSSSSVAIGFIFTPTIDGESIYTAGNASSSPSASATGYTKLTTQTNFTFDNATESNASFVAPISGIVAKKLRMRNSTAPGAAKSLAYALRINSGDSTVTCTNTGASTTLCSDLQHNASVSQGDLIDFSTAPSGTPTVGALNVYAVVLFIDPNDTRYGGTYYGATIY